jgi:DNA-binding transcriptional ArsR family regulator
VAIICGLIQVTHRLAPALRARFFRGLAEPARVAILDALQGGERTAGEVAAAAGLTISNASRHLACLKDCGLVEARQEWRHVYYRLAEGVEQVLAANDDFIQRVADRVAACDRPEMGGG